MQQDLLNPVILRIANLFKVASNFFPEGLVMIWWLYDAECVTQPRAEPGDEVSESLWCNLPIQILK